MLICARMKPSAELENGGGTERRGVESWWLSSHSLEVAVSPGHFPRDAVRAKDDHPQF